MMAMLMLNLSVFASTPLSRGTALSVRLMSSVDSKKKVTPTAMVECDVMKEGKVLIRKGTPVQLQVERKKARGCGRPGYMAIKCVSTTAVDGQSVVLEGNIDAEGDSKKGLAIGLGVGLGLFFWPCLGCLAIKGEQAVVESNTLINNVFVMNDYEVEVN